MKLIPFFGEGISSNSYLLICGGDAVLIDCAVLVDAVQSALAENGAVLRYIILTHGHFDHTETLDEMRDATGARVLIHENDAEMLGDCHKNGYADFFFGDYSVRDADRTLSEGEQITAGELALTVFHTPGHSKGSICLGCGDFLFTGDTLFANNIGRCDLYGGDGRVIMKSLRRLAGFKPDYEIYPGHGPASTLGREVAKNYYIRDALAME